jgi:hypothetical protein
VSGRERVPVIFCTAGERKHLIAEQHLEENSVARGVFLAPAAKAPASVWKVHRHPPAFRSSG